MEIQYLGHAGFVLKHKDVRLVCDPFGDSVGFKQAKVRAEIVTISHDHHIDHSDLSCVEGEPMVIKGPGEYEIKGVMVIGINSYHDDKQGKERGKNTIYLIEMDEVRIAHLGDQGDKLTEEQLDALDGVDVLLVGVGGDSAIGPEKAAEVIKQVGPSIVIPMHYKTKEHSKEWAKKASLKEFLDEIEMEPRKEKKLVVKKAELPEETELVVLSRYGG